MEGGKTEKGRAEARRYRLREKEKGRSRLRPGPAFVKLIPAVTYVPTQLPVQYHRPGEA
jgi:hypothetical protein